MDFLCKNVHHYMQNYINLSCLSVPGASMVQGFSPVFLNTAKIISLAVYNNHSACVPVITVFLHTIQMLLTRLENTSLSPYIYTKNTHTHKDAYITSKKKKEKNPSKSKVRKFFTLHTTQLCISVQLQNLPTSISQFLALGIREILNENLEIFWLHQRQRIIVLLHKYLSL